MKAPFKKLVSVTLGLVAVPLVAASACGGGDFRAAPDSDAGFSGASSGSGNSGGTQSGSGGTSTGVSCKGPEDCNDGDPCTVDRCGLSGECEVVPKCEAPLQCCDGDCGECCSHADCADELECTEDICFAGSCTRMPDDTKCEAGQYCSTIAGCRVLETCSGEIAGECEDGDPCTQDVCIEGFCRHPSCPEDTLCCPGVGCAECCGNSQCNDQDPCTADTCSGGVCKNEPLCSEQGTSCCVGADGTGASCGACCSASECSDGVACTIDACEAGGCTHTPDSSACPTGQTCHPLQGCITPAQCVGNDQCDDGIACTVDRCDGGVCVNVPDDKLCEPGSCSVEHGGCVECKGAFQCDDGDECTIDECDLKTFKCVFSPGGCGDKVCCKGRCAECCDDRDCSTRLLQFAPQPKVDAGLNLCSWPVCSDGVCKQQSVICDFGICCPGYGCALGPCPI